MKVIHSRINVNSNKINTNRTEILVWYLSVMKWKSLGHQPILYADKKTINYFKEIGLLDLYDEIYELNLSSINTEIFWASGKIFSAFYFMKNNPNEKFIISDLDFIPLQDPIKYSTNENEIIIFNREKCLEKYMDIEKLNLPPTYNPPSFYTGKIKPIEASLICINSNNVLNLFYKYLKFEILFMKNFKFPINNEIHKQVDQIMMFIEQRLFTEYMEYNNIQFTKLRPDDKSIFNKFGMHTGAYKILERRECYKWIIWYLKMIRDESKEIYNKIINLNIFNDFKNIIDGKQYKYKDLKGKITEINNFSWNNLAYPKAFEDIYE